MPRIRKFRRVVEMGMLYVLTPKQYREYLALVVSGRKLPVKLFGQPYARIDVDATDLSEDEASMLLAEVQDD